MIDIETVGFEDLKRLTRGTKVFRQALKATINKTARRASTAVSRQIRDKYAIRARDLRARRSAGGGLSNRQGIRVIRAKGQGDPEALILSAGRPLPLSNFRITPKTPQADRGRKRRRGVRYQVRRGERVHVRRAFVAQTKSGHVGVFMREGKDRLPIRQLYGPSVPQMFGEQSSLNALFRSVAAESPKILDQELRFRVKRDLGLIPKR